jgi:hypothetical protein
VALRAAAETAEDAGIASCRRQLLDGGYELATPGGLATELSGIQNITARRLPGSAHALQYPRS